MTWGFRLQRLGKTLFFLEFIREDTTINTFDSFPIKEEIKYALKEMGFETPTPIQAEIIPHILDGKDCLAEAPTGTGKTFGFGIPALNMIDATSSQIQVVVLCPTRELAMQTERELKKISVHIKHCKILAIYGGQPIERQMAGIRKKPQIIVATPGRLQDHIRRKSIRLQSAKLIVLDEADEMLNMGFKEDIDNILAFMPGNINMQLFSATMPKEILEISENYQVDPVRVKTTHENMNTPPIKQYSVRVKEGNKIEALKEIMRREDYHLVLVFTNTKRRAEEINEQLQDSNYLSAAIHGDLRQRIRDAVMRSYRNKELNILVATDVAARGIDVDNIEAIFNYDLPNDEDYYVHRIGRTARANRTGSAYNFATPKDQYRLKFYEKQTGVAMEELELEGLTERPRTNGKKEGQTRFFVNVGVKDGIKDKQLIAHITKNTAVKDSDISEVKMLEIFSFVEVADYVAEQMLTLNGSKFAKRVMAVEKAGDKNPSKSGGRDRNRGNDRQRNETRGSLRDNNRFKRERSDDDRRAGFQGDRGNSRSRSGRRDFNRGDSFDREDRQDDRRNDRRDFNHDSFDRDDNRGDRRNDRRDFKRDNFDRDDNRGERRNDRRDFKRDNFDRDDNRGERRNDRRDFKRDNFDRDDNRFDRKPSFKRDREDRYNVYNDAGRSRDDSQDRKYGKKRIEFDAPESDYSYDNNDSQKNKRYKRPEPNFKPQNKSDRKSYGDKKFGDKKNFGDKKFGDKKSFGDKKFGDKKSFGDRPSGDRKPSDRKFAPKSSGGRDVGSASPKRKKY